VLQRIDILEQGQKLDRKGYDIQNDDFDKLEAKVRRIDENLFAHQSKVDTMDQKLTGRVNDIDERMKVSPGGDIGAQMLEVVNDNGGRFSETLGEISREAARDVLDNFDFEYHHVERAVEDAVERIDLSECIDWESLHASQFDLLDFAECLVEESPFSYPLRSIDEHEERLDKLSEEMCSVITSLETMGIALAPANNRQLYGDKRDASDVYGDRIADMFRTMTAEQRQNHYDLITQTCAQNKEEGNDGDEA
jgi:hypothetical protein